MFARFAARHDLEFEIARDVPVEVLWTFPAQPKLAMPLTLGMSNSDELHFGVERFWTYLFPFPEVAEEFERWLDAWVIGEARIAKTSKRGRIFQLWTGQEWEKVYSSDERWFFRKEPFGFIDHKTRAQI